MSNFFSDRYVQMISISVVRYQIETENNNAVAKQKATLEKLLLPESSWSELGIDCFYLT